MIWDNVLSNFNILVAKINNNFEMQFQYDLESLLNPDANGMVRIEGANLSKTLTFSQSYNPKTSAKEKIVDLIDVIGKASADAQSLTNPVTSYAKLANSHQRIYLKIEQNKVLGYIKIGEKNLTYRHQNGKFSEITPVCVLDFFVFPAVQRKGIGKQLFDNMLFYENIQARKLAIDRPSYKFLAFLARHYGLEKFVTQINHYVVFNQFFEENAQDEALKAKKLVPLLPSAKPEQPKVDVKENHGMMQKESKV